MFDVLIHITSDHVDFVDAVDYRGSVTMGDFGLRIGEKTEEMVRIIDGIKAKRNQLKKKLKYNYHWNFVILNCCCIKKSFF